MLDAKIQTPVSAKVLTKARNRASEIGFGSINDVIRIMLKQFAEGTITFSMSTLEDSGIPYISEKEQEGIKKQLAKNKKNGMGAIARKKTIVL